MTYEDRPSARINHPPRHTLFLGWGEWKIEEIKVKVYSETYASIFYEKYEVNAERHYKNVYLRFWERRKGLTLEGKVELILANLISELKRENAIIANCREMSKRLSKGS